LSHLNIVDSISINDVVNDVVILMEIDWLVEQSNKLEKLQSDNGLVQILHELLSPVGFHSFLESIIPIFSNENHLCLPAPLTNFNSDWMDHYIKEDYVQHDYALKSLLLNPDTPYLWQPEKEMKSLKGREKAVRSECLDAGLVNGISVPTDVALGMKGISTLEFDGDQSEMLYQYQLHGKSIITIFQLVHELRLNSCIDDYQNTAMPILTPKEIEVLQWMAAGLTYDQVGDKLKVGTSTIRKHASSLIKKLGANNMTHAVAVAVKWKLVR